MQTADPWLYLDEHFPDAKVLVRFLPHGQWGRVEWTDPPTITLRANLGPIARRTTLWHEIGHLELDTNDEQPVIEWTARWLLRDIEEVGRLLSTMDVRDAARELRVTRCLLLKRLNCMDAAEEQRLAVVMGRAA